MAQSAARTLRLQLAPVGAVVGIVLLIAAIVTIDVSEEDLFGFNQVDATWKTMRKLDRGIATYLEDQGEVPMSLSDLYGPDSVLGGLAPPTDAWGGEFLYVRVLPRRHVLISLGADHAVGGEGYAEDLRTGPWLPRAR